MQSSYKKILYSKISILLAASAIFCGPMPGAALAQDTGEAEMAKISGEAPKQKKLRDPETLMYEMKRLKNVIASSASNYAENDANVKTFFRDFLNALNDANVTAIESAGISEELAELLTILKTVEDGEEKILKQFSRVLDAADVPRSEASKMSENTKQVLSILRKKKEGPGEADSLIYKYYGVEGKGHKAHLKKDEKIKGYSSFFGKDENGGDGSNELLKKYGDDESKGKKKKIVGMEFMDPYAENSGDSQEAAVTKPAENKKEPGKTPDETAETKDAGDKKPAVENKTEPEKKADPQKKSEVDEIFNQKK